MKKRILALALAGTTAFSVFGMAVSAIGGDIDSTHTRYTEDAYVSYDRVAKTITVATDGALSLNYYHVEDDTNYDAADLSVWAFNKDTTGAANIDLTSYNYVNAYQQVYQNTAFAYDFIYTNNMPEVDKVTGAWNAGTFAFNPALAAELTWTAETGRGNRYFGVRYDVINDWEAFLEELAIWDNGHYKEDKEDFIDLYKDYLYTDYYYLPDGTKVPNKVDLYNIKELLEDIYALNSEADYTNANTSELVYLMQQYDHYIGEYINVAPVESSEWTELLISLLEAANADDFKKSVDYKKYVNRVEDMVAAYEEATTANMIKEVSEDMYDLLADSIYRSTGVDKTALGAAMNGLYWNVAAAPDNYATDAKTTKTTNVAFKNYGFFFDYTLFINEDDAADIGFQKETKFYSLYPAADYAQAYNFAANYYGNDGVAPLEVTDEYEWFLNVYELAAAMKKGNAYQGSVDAINDVLAEAVEALEVTVTPYRTEVSALEEMVEYYDGKIESDYNAGYYGMYVSANEYAENVEGKYATRNAREMVAIAGDSLTYQGTQVTVTKNDIKAVKAAIAEAEAAIASIKNSKEYNAAQVTALNKAIATAEAVVALYDGVDPTGKINHVPTRLVADKDQILKSTVTDAIEAIDAAINYATVVEGWSKNADGEWQYGEDGEYVAEGWKKIGSSWYLFEDGAAVESDWRKIDGKWYYLNKNCAAAYGWCKVDGEWYYFDGSNAMKTGWVKVDGSWYYLAASGKMVTGEQTIDGVKYNFSTESNSLGQML